MRYLEQPYYVGLLSAAAIHGSAHQQPMVFQVLTDRPTRSAHAGRVRIAFHMNRSLATLPVVTRQTETGSMRVSTPEGTAFDLIRFAAASGHLSKVATVLSELAENIDPERLAGMADFYVVPEVQRLGYLMGVVGAAGLSNSLAGWLTGRRYRPILLAPGEAKGKAKADPRCRVVANATVDPDI